MKKTRRRYDREFKISIVAELEGGKPARSRVSPPAFSSSSPPRRKAGRRRQRGLNQPSDAH